MEYMHPVRNGDFHVCVRTSLERLFAPLPVMRGAFANSEELRRSRSDCTERYNEQVDEP